MTQTAPPDDRLTATDPPVLLAVMIAAKRTGDVMLADIARRELEDRHDIIVRFGGRTRPEVSRG